MNSNSLSAGFFHPRTLYDKTRILFSESQKKMQFLPCLLCAHPMPLKHHWYLLDRSNLGPQEGGNQCVCLWCRKKNLSLTPLLLLSNHEGQHNKYQWNSSARIILFFFFLPLYNLIVYYSKVLTLATTCKTFTVAGLRWHAGRASGAVGQPVLVEKLLVSRGIRQCSIYYTLLH